MVITRFLFHLSIFFPNCILVVDMFQVVFAHQGVRYNQPQASDSFGRLVEEKRGCRKSFFSHMVLTDFGFVFPTGFWFCSGRH